MGLVVEVATIHVKVTVQIHVMVGVQIHATVPALAVVLDGHIKSKWSYDLR